MGRNLQKSRARQSFRPVHRADLGAIKGAAIPGPEARDGLWTRLRRANAAFEETIWADALGAIFLALFAYLVFVIAGVMS